MISLVSTLMSNTINKSMLCWKARTCVNL